MSTAAGGVLTTNVNVPASFWVWALKALTNSMMFTPCWPRAGPTGGAGLAWPPVAWSLMVVRTFLAIGRWALGVGRWALDLLDLVEAHFDRGLSTEDGD